MSDRSRGGGYRFDRYRIVSGVSVTNKTPSDDYRTLTATPPEGPWISHNEMQKLKPTQDFELNLELVDYDSLQVALEKNNPWEEDAGATIEGLSIHGPGFPTILVGPNAGGKSVALKMIETLHVVTDFLRPHLREFAIEDLFGIEFHIENFENRSFELTPNDSINLKNSLNQWDWLGPSWDLEVAFEEYSLDPAHVTHTEGAFITPVVTVGNYNQKLTFVNMAFRKSKDCWQIRLSLPDGDIRILMYFDEFEDLMSLRILTGKMYNLLSEVGDQFLPISELLTENTDPSIPSPFWSCETFHPPRITTLTHHTENILEKAIHLDEDFIDVFLSSDCDFVQGSWYDFLGEDLPYLPSSILDETAENMGIKSSAIRIDTLRRSSTTQSLLTPTQRAVADICSSLNKAWQDTLEELSNPDFKNFNSLIYPHDFPVLQQFEDGEIPEKYNFPILNGRVYGGEDRYPPFSPSKSLAQDLLDNIDPLNPEQKWHPEEESLINRIDDTKLSELYHSIWFWNNNGTDNLESLAEAHKTLRQALDGKLDTNFDPLFWNLLKPQNGLFSSHLEYEAGPKNFLDAQFSIFSHAHLTVLKRLRKISHDLKTISHTISEYLGLDINIFPIIREDIEKLIEQPTELDKIAEQMGLPYLSSGQAQLLTMLTQLELSAYTASVVLLDEPELSLHDKLIADLYDYLCEYSRIHNVQVICSTHSTTLAGLGLEHSVFVERKDDLDE